MTILALELLKSELQAIALARLFHETYERLAPEFGYKTRKDTREFSVDTTNGRLMVAVCREILDEISIKIVEV